MDFRKTYGKHLTLVLGGAIVLLAALVSTMDLYSVRFVDYNGSILIATSNYNYAIASSRLATKGWRTVSVNNNDLYIITSNNEKLNQRSQDLSIEDLRFLEALRDEIANARDSYSSISTAQRPPSDSSSGIVGGSTYSSSHESSSTFSLSSSSFSTQQGVSGNDISLSVRDADNFSVAKSDLPFEWSRVFFNGDLVTVVMKSGHVKMSPISLLEPVQMAEIQKLKTEVKDMQRKQEIQFSNTMKNSMDMVSNMFNNIMGTFPKPPSFNSAVGDTFGNRFPFGPSGSPFAAESGWPFGNNAGAVAGDRGAYAFAGL